MVGAKVARGCESHPAVSVKMFSLGFISDIIIYDNDIATNRCNAVLIIIWNHSEIILISNDIYDEISK